VFLEGFGSSSGRVRSKKCDAGDDDLQGASDRKSRRRGVRR
jgi:hypothetical protein